MEVISFFMEDQMLFSFSLIIILGFSLQSICQKLRLPGLIGMLFSGIILGPFVLDLISPTILNISTDLRKIALIVILVRAGLSIDLKDLRKVGRPALLMCFLPAMFEITAVTILAPPLMHMTYLEGAILGSILGAVSPAIAVPKMLHLMETGYGQKHRVPQIIMAGASIDNIFNIAVFTTLMGIYASQEFRPVTMLKLPVSILAGMAVGIFIGFILVKLFKAAHMRDTVKVLIVLGISFFLVGLEEIINQYVPFSALLAVMALGISVMRFHEILARRIAGKFSKIWVAAELVLFVLLGTLVDIRYIAQTGLSVIILILAALFFRSIGVYLSVSGSGLSRREKLFCVIAYWPKATVQAAIGALPLAAGMAAGHSVLTAAVLAVLITSPIGSICIEQTCYLLLDRETDISLRMPSK
jgi:solute carrier family 9B (sodium/hydrogen exchanger), member 1/2